MPLVRVEDDACGVSWRVSGWASRTSDTDVQTIFCVEHPTHMGSTWVLHWFYMGSIWILYGLYII